MMNYNLNYSLVDVMKNALPEKNNLALHLADLLSLGKEAVYRRLRGIVSFNIDEMALITKYLNTSLDEIIGIESSGKALFNINFESPYALLECSNSELSTFKIPSFLSMYFFNHQMFKVFKAWVDSLKRSSTFISSSGDVHRAESFTEQRDLLNTIF